MLDWSIAAECRPYLDVSGGSAVWHAETAEPWLEIRTVRRIANRWLRLTWRSGLYESVCRPVIRCFIETRSGERIQDLFLPTAPFGRGHFLFHVPAGTRRVLLSPVNRTGNFRFEIEQIERLPIAHVFIEAARRSPGPAALAYCAFWVARYRDMRFLLRDALAEIPSSAYATWRRLGLRPADPKFDGPRPTSSPRLRLILEPNEESLDAIVGSINALQTDLAAEAAGGVEIVVPLRPDLRTAIAGRALPANCRLVETDVRLEELTADLADTDLIAAVPVGTRLQQEAVAMLRSTALAHPSADLIYGDDDCMGDCNPTIRPGFDPLLLHSFDYVGAAAIWRVGTAKRLASDPEEFEAKKITNEEMPRRRLPDPALALNGHSLQRFLFRFPGKTVNVRPHLTSRTVFPTAPSGGVDILIPTRDRLDLLKPCVDSILAKTEGDFQICILDNDSCEPATLAYFAVLCADPRVTVLKVPGPFNFSRICNEGVRQTTQNILIFLNNDTSVIDADWVTRLRAMAIRPDVGAVGAKLLYPNDRVQHAGVIAGLFGRAGHFEYGMTRDDPGFFGRATVPHRLTAVTGACLAVARDKFLSVDGFDQENLPIDLNDIDLCFRLIEKGYATVQLGDCLLYHHESASRGHPRVTEQFYKKERDYYSSKWLHILRADHHFSANLTLYSVRARLG